MESAKYIEVVSIEEAIAIRDYLISNGINCERVKERTPETVLQNTRLANERSPQEDIIAYYKIIFDKDYNIDRAVLYRSMSKASTDGVRAQVDYNRGNIVLLNAAFKKLENKLKKESS